MITAILEKLFGSNDPVEAARRRLPAWREWLAPVSEKLPLGSDLSYDDDFLAIKDEVAKLSGLDVDLVIETCEKLLKETAKDARPAAYYAYARLRREGLAGLAEGLELTAALIDRFGQDLGPARPETRRAALSWLAGETVIDGLRLLTDIDRLTAGRVLAALALIGQLTREWPAAGRPDLRPLAAYFERLLSQAETRAAEGANASQPPAALPEGPSSGRDLLERGRQMSLYLRREPGGYLSAFRLMRALRWDSVSEAPPAGPDGRTRLSPPRAELRNLLKRLYLRQQWGELLERVELSFAESMNHFWLDLAFWAAAAQAEAGPPYASFREPLLVDFGQMLERLPGLERLSFSDGFPFADDATLEWIGRQVRPLGAASPLETVSASAVQADEWRETQIQAEALARESGLDEAFAWIAALPPVSGRRSGFLRRSLMARLAAEHGRPDMALHLYEALAEEASAFALDRWEPELSFEVKRQLWRILQQKSLRKDADRPAVRTRLEKLAGELAALNPLKALALTKPDK